MSTNSPVQVSLYMADVLFPPSLEFQFHGTRPTSWPRVVTSRSDLAWVTAQDCLVGGGVSVYVWWLDVM